MLTQPKPSPVSERVVRTLEERIQTGVYRDGFRLPSERELSSEFQVSRLTIRAAIDTMVERGMLDRSARCRPVVRHTNTTMPVRSRTVTTNRRSIAIWIWPGIDHPASSAIIKGIRQSLDADAYRLLLESPPAGSWRDVAQAENQFLQRIVAEEDCEGVLFWCVGGTASIPALHRLREADIPVVFLDRQPPPGFDGDHVGTDNLYSAMEAVRHLIALGHRRIVHITNSDNASTVRERELGYRKAMATAGLSVRPEWILRDTGGEDAGSVVSPVGTDALLALLRSDEPPTAAFTVNDNEAFLLLDTLKRNGIQVPNDFSVIGFDGAESWRPSAPYLSSMYQPFERIGERAVGLLQERLSSNTGPCARHVLLSATLVAAETTGPPPESL